MAKLGEEEEAADTDQPDGHAAPEPMQQAAREPASPEAEGAPGEPLVGAGAAAEHGGPEKPKGERRRRQRQRRRKHGRNR